ncbi:MAG: hypothetical protein JST93_13130 [Acidobacteria bacterium]|nr:hypothetical protein [Acidobacteriota bacterium]
MLDIIYRYDPEHPSLRAPRTPAEAKKLLEEGNRVFARLSDPNAAKSGPAERVIPFDLSDMGLDEAGEDVPKQQPFAGVLGCADARVPVEMIFNQGSNALFVVRVAGNVLGAECEGSLDYAAGHFPSMKLVVVLGHTRCGAVQAAANAFLKPEGYLAVAQNDNLRVILDRLLISVRIASQALEAEWGSRVRAKRRYTDALVDMSVSVNAALAAHTLRHDLGSAARRLLYGVYDLGSRLVRLPLGGPGDELTDAGLYDPPKDAKGFEELAGRLAGSRRTGWLLKG